MGNARYITEILCRLLVLCLVLLGILLIALNIALMLVSVVTGQILNPSFRMLIGMTLFGWIAAFALAGLVHIASLRWFRAAGPESRCRDCGYDLRGSIDSPRCPECGRPWNTPHHSERNGAAEV